MTTIRTGIYLLIIIMIIAFTGCISWSDSDTVSINSDTPIEIGNPQMPDIDELHFFSTIEEAVEHNTMEDFPIRHIDEIIKLLESDEYAVLFFRVNMSSGNDVIYVFKFIIQETNGKPYYSTPVIATIVSWEAHKLFIKRGKLDEIGEIRAGISRDSLRWFRVDEAKNFFWGLSQTERVRNLRIEGQLVTEVIEVELDGETAFFWYFEDLVTDKKPTFKDLRQYTEGEFIITMDE